LFVFKLIVRLSATVHARRLSLFGHIAWVTRIRCQADLNSFPVGELEETTGTPPYYVDEDYPAGPEISARPVGQPGCGRRLPQPGQLTIGEELLGYHNNNNNLKSMNLSLNEATDVAQNRPLRRLMSMFGTTHS